MSKLISMDKKYKTRDGRDVRVLCTDNTDGGAWTVVALIEGSVSNFTSTGRYWNSNKECGLDLLEVAQEHELWVEIFYTGTGHVRTVYYFSENTLRNGVESNSKFYGGDYKLIATKKITYVEGETCL